MKKYLLITTLTIMSITLSACGSTPEKAVSQTTGGNLSKSNEPADIIDFDASAPVSLTDQSQGGKVSQVASSTPDIASSSASFPAIASQSDLASQYSQAIIHTNQGDITVAFYAPDAPKAVNNFLHLSQSGFYDTVKFHRVIKGFMIQGGDPNSKDDDWSNDGYGGPGYKFEDEINDHKLVRGNLAMANSGPDTNGSQFFIVTAEATPFLDGGYTNFGYVTKGMDVVDKIENLPTNENDHPTEDAIIYSVELVK